MLIYRKNKKQTAISIEYFLSKNKILNRTSIRYAEQYCCSDERFGKTIYPKHAFSFFLRCRNFFEGLYFSK